MLRNTLTQKVHDMAVSVVLELQSAGIREIAVLARWVGLFADYYVVACDGVF